MIGVGAAFADLANDLSHALDVSETTNAELLQRLEEAEAVASQVRALRDEFKRSLEYAGIDASKSKHALGRWGALLDVCIALDGIDGL